MNAEQGLQSYGSIQGAAKWKAIGDVVEVNDRYCHVEQYTGCTLLLIIVHCLNCLINVQGKSATECVDRFKFLRSELQRKKKLK